jgi:two-component system, LytTR family, sensor kinase
MRHNKFPLYITNFTTGNLKFTGATENNFRMNRKKAYWISQITGWLAIAIVNIILLASLKHINVERTISVFYFCFLGVCFTHMFRGVIKKHNWINLPLKKIIPRVFISSLIIGLIIYTLMYALDLAIGVAKLERFKIAILLLENFQVTTIILLWELIYFSVHYFEKYKRVEIESYIWEAAVKDFELKTLKSQLNPHFMFNALNSIRALIDVDPVSAQTAVTRLSNLLRYSLRMERIETVSLQEEMLTVTDYLELESIRFEERLKFKIDIDPKSAKLEIPPMMIQTLVENGIKHGISKKTEGGEITVKSKVINTNLYIEIENTGHIEESALQNSSGFGINNTKHRLHLLYGEDASFSIKNESKNTVLAKLVIPTGGIKNEIFNN